MITGAINHFKDDFVCIFLTFKISFTIDDIIRRLDDRQIILRMVSSAYDWSLPHATLSR